jgi:Xaa-Pro aminopeptidase
MEIQTNRVVKAQRLLAEQDYDLLVLSPSTNMFYLSGFCDEPSERLLFFILPREGSPVFLALSGFPDSEAAEDA